MANSVETSIDNCEYAQMIAYIQSWQTPLRRSSMPTHASVRTHESVWGFSYKNWQHRCEGTQACSAKPFSTPSQRIFLCLSFPPYADFTDLWSVIYGKWANIQVIYSHVRFECVTFDASAFDTGTNLFLWLLESNTTMGNEQRFAANEWMNESDKMNSNRRGMNEMQWIVDDSKCPSFERIRKYMANTCTMKLCDETEQYTILAHKNWSGFYVHTFTFEIEFDTRQTPTRTCVYAYTHTHIYVDLYICLHACVVESH